MDYKLIDSGNGQKLERFGEVTLIRPAANAIWAPELPEKVWQRAHASFSREEGAGWQERTSFPKEWEVTLSGVRLKLKCTDFGHLGIFPEQAPLWKTIQEKIAMKQGARVLNLFAYSG